MTTQTPDAVREAATQRLQQFADGAELLQIYGPEWCGFPTIELRRDLSAILAALDSRGGDAGWHDIETAPKDGTEVDLWVRPYTGKSHRKCGYWWVTGIGWRTNSRADDIPVSAKVTHWSRPLPSPHATPAPAVDAVPAGEVEQ